MATHFIKLLSRLMIRTSNPSLILEGSGENSGSEFFTIFLYNLLPKISDYK
jgi:hypothetical protein